MKIAYFHLVDRIRSKPKPSIGEISERLFQLGHEHEIANDIFDIEFTPNRGDCLSIKGLLRDLSLFYQIDNNYKTYQDDIDHLSINFKNNAIDACTSISFLKIKINKNIMSSSYNGVLHDYFSRLNLNTNNIFTDISNYVSYETGQPTHCYDFKLLGESFCLERLSNDNVFHTLFDTNINLTDSNLVFTKEDEIINLAGVVGGKSTACSHDTKTVLVECAYFNPEDIIGKSIKYDIQSDAAYKFERGTDPESHNFVLRRFLQILQNHVEIEEVQLFSKTYIEYEKKFLPYDLDAINNILGTKILDNEYKQYLIKLGFLIKSNIIEIPSHRSDVLTQNDLSEEIARAIGYNNIHRQKLSIPFKQDNNLSSKEIKLKRLLIDNGFYEVVNNPFVKTKKDSFFKVDNPLDSNRQYIRTNLKQSLLDDLLYNERRQKDSIKIFEISDIYSSSGTLDSKRVIGIITTGRVGKNYNNFCKNIDKKYIQSILKNYVNLEDINIENIDRSKIDTKIKSLINYVEINLDNIEDNIITYDACSKPPEEFIKYSPISEFPMSTRDISFSIKNYSKSEELQDNILNYKNSLIKDIFIFDYYKNVKNNEIKMGFRFLFQSSESTITDADVNSIMDDIIKNALKIESVTIPGLKA